jgi:hypothetical protein
MNTDIAKEGKFAETRRVSGETALGKPQNPNLAKDLF